ETFVCPVTHHKCKNHKCIPRDLVCDFTDDCGDNSDELGCVRPVCGFGYFMCANGECTKTTQLCDGVLNCKDGSDEDERNCEKYFKCKSGFYINPSYRCNHWADCKLSHDDEIGCDGVMCLYEHLHRTEWCDVVFLFFLLSDTSHCDLTSHFLCRRSARCIKNKFVCDDVDNCLDSLTGSDEYNCRSKNSTDCSAYGELSKFVTCKDGRCLDKRISCDQKPDCVDGEDETACGTLYVIKSCGPNEFQCELNGCVPESQRCDGTADCLDWSDEKDCLKHVCPVDHVQCGTGHCIPALKRCDHWPDCRDGSDENLCTYRNCTAEEYRCANGECISLQMVCYNGTKGQGRGCRDNSNLLDCTPHVCQGGQFKCTNSYCVDQEQVCDTRRDCIFNFADELNCRYPCPYRNGNCWCLDQAMNCENRSLTSMILHSEHEAIIKLYMRNNMIGQTFNTTSFSDKGKHLDKVTYIDLSNNQITEIPENVFLFMWRLKYLNLVDNMITDIKSKSLAGLKNLTQLYLTGNKVSSIEGGAFLDLSQLTILDLSRQNISSLKPNTFLGLHSLHMLNLSGNRIRQLYDGTFNGLQSLISLDLSGNEMVYVGNRVFYSLPQLRVLITDKFKFCCLAKGVDKCLPEPDEFSSCGHLMANYVLRISIWLLGLVAFFGNMLVIVWRARDMRGRKVHSILITNLAVGDLLMGVYLIIVAVVDAYYRDVYMAHDETWRQSALCQLAGFISTFSSELSVFTLSVITIDRLICIILPLRMTRLSVKNASCTMLFVWVLVFFISVVPLMEIPYFKVSNFYGRSGVCLALHITPERPPGWQFSVAVFLVLNLISFLVIALSYIWMFLVARETRSAGTIETKSDAAMARRMTLIVMTDFACWIPIILLGFVSLAGGHASNDVYAWVAVFVLPLNSAVNPVLYTLSTAPFVGNIRSKVYRFRKSFKSSSSQETKHSYIGEICNN
ncbi:unnamed protein product, partial [Lymnaea stagnalis]